MAGGYIQSFRPEATYVAPDVNFYKNMADVRQERYTNTLSAINAEKQKLGQIATYAPLAKQQELDKFQTDLDNISNQYKGDLSAAAKDLSGRIAQEASNPFWNANMQHYKAMEEQNKMIMGLRAQGERVLPFQTVRPEDLALDSTTGMYKTNYTSNIQGALDYQKDRRDVWNAVGPISTEDKDLKNIGTYGLTGFLRSGTIAGIDKTRIENNVNAAFDAYKGKKTYAQEKNALLAGLDAELDSKQLEAYKTANKLSSLDEAADDIIKNRMVNEGLLKVGQSTKFDYMQYHLPQPKEDSSWGGGKVPPVPLTFSGNTPGEDIKNITGLKDNAFGLTNNTNNTRTGTGWTLGKKGFNIVSSEYDTIRENNRYNFQNSSEQTKAFTNLAKSVSPELYAQYNSANTPEAQNKVLDKLVPKVEAFKKAIQVVSKYSGSYGDAPLYKNYSSTQFSNAAVNEHLFQGTGDSNSAKISSNYLPSGAYMNMMAYDPETKTYKNFKDLLVEYKKGIEDGQEGSISTTGILNLDNPYALGINTNLAGGVVISVSGGKNPKQYIVQQPTMNLPGHADLYNSVKAKTRLSKEAMSLNGQYVNIRDNDNLAFDPTRGQFVISTPDGVIQNESLQAVWNMYDEYAYNKYSKTK